jgi:hypothetical protein
MLASKSEDIRNLFLGLFIRPARQRTAMADARGSDDGVRQKLAAGVKIASVAARQHRDGDESDIQ